MIETKESDLDSPRVLECATIRHALRITFDVTAADRVRLEAIVANRGSPQKRYGAKIILMSDNGLGTVAIMAATGKSKTCVWRWQERFMAECVDGLLRDKSRPPGIAPLDPELVDQVVALTLETPRQEASHWTVRATNSRRFAPGWQDIRWTFHFVPTSCSWLNAVEGFFAKLTRRRLKHGVFHSVVDLQAAINRFIKEHNQEPRP